VIGGGVTWGYVLRLACKASWSQSMVKTAVDILSTSFNTTQLSDKQLVLLNQLSASDAQELVRAVYYEVKSDPSARYLINTLASRCEFSTQSISEWVGEVLKVYGWIKNRGESAKFCDILDYVGCALEGSSLQMGHDILWYLSEYGFERVVRCR
jgi:hypothetical protein